MDIRKLYEKRARRALHLARQSSGWADAALWEGKLPQAARRLDDAMRALIQHQRYVLLLQEMPMPCKGKGKKGGGRKG